MPFISYRLFFATLPVTRQLFAYRLHVSLLFCSIAMTFSGDRWIAFPHIARLPNASDHEIQQLRREAQLLLQSVEQEIARRCDLRVLRRFRLKCMKTHPSMPMSSSQNSRLSDDDDNPGEFELGIRERIHNMYRVLEKYKQSIHTSMIASAFKNTNIATSAPKFLCKLHPQFHPLDIV